jgi:hypothetical protein
MYRPPHILQDLLGYSCALCSLSVYVVVTRAQFLERIMFHSSLEAALEAAVMVLFIGAIFVHNFSVM